MLSLLVLVVLESNHLLSWLLVSNSILFHIKNEWFFSEEDIAGYQTVQLAVNKSYSVLNLFEDLKRLYLISLFNIHKYNLINY